MKYDDIFVTSIDGSDSMNARRNTIREFNKVSKGIICSARVLNEGVNIPIVDSVCFVDARDSTIDIIQCLGRCLRLCPGKNIAYVIVPIFIKDFDDDFDKHVFGNIIRILKALKNTDERIVEYFSLKNRRKIGTRKIIASETYVNISKKIDIIEWNDNIQTNLWKMCVRSWDDRYLELRQWIGKNKKFPSQYFDGSTESSLNLWCKEQRKCYKDNILSDERIEKMNKIANWCWCRDSDAIWHKNCAGLKQWVEENNNMHPIINTDNSDEKKLAVWSQRQKREYKLNILSAEQIKCLNEINGWHWFVDRNQLWNNKYVKLKRWITANKKFPSGKSKNKKENRLSRWTQTQKKSYTKNKLSAEQIKCLNEINGWRWVVDLNQIWNNKYMKLKRWIIANKKLPVCKSKNKKEKKLGGWIHTQKQAYINDKMSDYRINMLNQLKYWYWTPKKIIDV